jgi:hypothetical protein
MLDALEISYAFPCSAFNFHARPRRSEYVQSIRGAYLMDPEQVRSVADNHQPPQSVGAGNHRDAPG